jgi:AraC-like DNA-binding protein
MIAALVADPVARARLTAAMRLRTTASGAPEPIMWCGKHAELYAAVADHGARMAVVELSETFRGRERHGEEIGESIVRALHDEFPTVPVLVYTALTPIGASAILNAGRAGAVEVIIAGQDDLGRGLLPVLAKAEATAIVRRATERVSEVATPGVAAIVDYALRQARCMPSVRAAARVLRVHRKTLAQWCVRDGAPPPGVLITWGRLIVAADQLSDPGRSAESVATDCGFASGSALANALRRWTGLARAALLEAGGGVVLEMLVRRLAQGAASAPGPRRQTADEAHPSAPGGKGGSRAGRRRAG